MRLLRAPEVVELTGLARSTIYKMEKEGRFPKRRIVSPQVVGWLEQDVREWLEQLPTADEAQRASA